MFEVCQEHVIYEKGIGPLGYTVYKTTTTHHCIQYLELRRIVLGPLQ